MFPSPSGLLRHEADFMPPLSGLLTMTGGIDDPPRFAKGRNQGIFATRKEASMATLAECICGGTLDVRVTPKASADRIRIEADPASPSGFKVRVDVVAAPDKGKANAAVIALLAKALRVAPSSIVLHRGAAARDKRFRIATRS
jgi:uncharacterized protein